MASEPFGRGLAAAGVNGEQGFGLLRGGCCGQLRPVATWGALDSCIYNGWVVDTEDELVDAGADRELVPCFGEPERPVPLMRITHQLPNVFTAARLVATVPLVRRIRSGRTGWETAVGVAAWAATDWVDGRLARRMHWESVIGKTLDPLADRAGISAIAWSLAKAGELPRRVPITVFIGDPTTAVLTSQAAYRGQLRVSYLGKVRSAVLFVALVVAAAGPKKRGRLGRMPHALADLGAVLHVLAGVSYIRAARERPSPCSP